MLTIIIACCAFITISILLIIFIRPKKISEDDFLLKRITILEANLKSIETNLKEDFWINRDENYSSSTENRRELNETLKEFKDEMSKTLHSITEQSQTALERINHTLDEKSAGVIHRLEENNKQNRETLSQNLKDFTIELKGKFDELKTEQKELTVQTADQLEKATSKLEAKMLVLTEQSEKSNRSMREVISQSLSDFQQAFDRNVKSFNDLQREKFSLLDDKQSKLVNSTEKKLEQMRETVEEKLQKTLNDRLGQSFDLVVKHLESVQKGIGEVQSIAQDVGGLKKVLANVKMRGGFGEVQLSMLLENVLAPDQYEANVRTKEGSGEQVEFAIKFPNKDGDRDYVWLPIDAKFPKEIYEQLQNAHDSGDLYKIEEAQKIFENGIKKMAKDISDKYLDPPNTLDFAIMFLPFEGIYAEVVRKASLLEEIQRQYKVVITGPTTLAAILHSFQMGFRSLAIQKRSSEVWSILSAVKKEFSTFGGILQKAQNNIQTGLNQLDDIVGVRTRAIQKKLKGVEVLSETVALPEALQEEEMEQ